MPRYERAGAEVGQIVERMMERYHPQLRDAGVTLTFLAAFPLTDENGDSKGPALKVNGYQALAAVKIIGLKERTDGRADAEIVIDGERWHELDSDQKDALLDHELEHLELKYDKDGLLVRDDLNRPKFVMRKHDHQFGWFDSIVRRHGRAALEFQQFEKFQTTTYKENWLPFLDEPDTTPVVAEAPKELAEGTGEGLPPASDTTVTVSSPGRDSVTLKASDFGKLAKNIKKAKRGGFAGKPSKGGRRAAAHA